MLASVPRDVLLLIVMPLGYRDTLSVACVCRSCRHRLNDEAWRIKSEWRGFPTTSIRASCYQYHYRVLDKTHGVARVFSFQQERHTPLHDQIRAMTNVRDVDACQLHGDVYIVVLSCNMEVFVANRYRCIELPYRSRSIGIDASDVHVRVVTNSGRQGIVTTLTSDLDVVESIERNQECFIHTGVRQDVGLMQGVLTLHTSKEMRIVSKNVVIERNSQSFLCYVKKYE
jgi:hypothetical protein